MSDASDLGVVYTEHSDLRVTPLSSLWSYETEARGLHRRPIERNRDGNHRYWLEPSDPLLNTILPGTAVSVVVNFGDQWAAGRSPATSALLPRCAVIGPVTEARVLSIGPRIDAIGAVVSAVDAREMLGLPPSHLVDQIVSLEDLWGEEDVEQFLESLAVLSLRPRLATLSQALIARAIYPRHGECLGQEVSHLISARRGCVSIDKIAVHYGVTRQHLARTFFTATGVTPKLFARITRFQAVVRALLSSDIADWASVATAVGFYDQAHMINDFREFAGSSPRIFFQGQTDPADARTARLRGRPHEWQTLKG